MIGIKILISTIVLILSEHNICAEGNSLQYKDYGGSDEIIAQLVSKKLEDSLSSKLIELENNILKKLNHMNRKLASIHNEMQDLKTTTLGRAQIIPDDKTYALVELNQTAKAYNQIVKRKPFVELTVSWKNSLCCEKGNKSIVTLDGREVWSSTGFANSATFKVFNGGRYQTEVHQCNGDKCSHSDPTEIVVADTDGNHLLPSQSKTMKNYFKPTSGKVVGAIYVETNMFTPSSGNRNILDMPIHNITHLMYGIIEICGAENITIPTPRVCEDEDNYKIYVNSTETALANSTISNQTYYDGSFGQMMMLKKDKPDLKILAAIARAIGNPFIILKDELKKDIFISSVKEFLRTWKFFDGLNLSWNNGEQPLDYSDDELMEDLMKRLRETLDDLSQETNKKYSLTLTVPARIDTLLRNNFGRLNKFVDYVFVLNYMLKGPWTRNIGHHSGVYAPAWNPSENYTTDFAVKHIINQGVSHEKIVITVSLYGVGWSGVHNYSNDNPLTGQFEKPYQKGFFHHDSLRDELAQGKWEYHYDDVAEAAYSFRKDTGDLLSYDDARSITAKAKYVSDNNLGGLYLIGEYIEQYDVLEAMNMGLGNKL